MYEIKKDRKLPTVGRTRYPFDQMVKGDSVFVPVQSMHLGGSLQWAKNKTGMIFVRRKMIEDGVEGTCVFCMGTEDQVQSAKLKLVG